MKPKILIFSLAYSPLWGGAELAVKEITDRIGDCEFDMVTKKFRKDSLKKERIGNINVYRINSSKLFFPFIAYFKARRLHKKNNYNIIWSIMANRASFAALFFKLNFPKIKFLLTLQEGDPFEYIEKRAGVIWPFIKFLFRKIFTKADYIQCISNYLADWAKRMGAKCPIEVIPNGVSLEIYKSCDREIYTQKEKRKETTIITTSRLVPKNGIADLIDATKILIDRGHKIKTLILGAGPLEKNLKFKIKNLSADRQDLKLQNKILLLGHVAQEKIPEYLMSADIFVRPSLSEGLGTSFLEAMAAGLPVVATPVGGILDFVKHEETGLFAESNNPQSVAEQIELLIKDEKLKNHIINNGKKLIFENYNWNIIAKKMQVVFSKILLLGLKQEEYGH